MRILAWLFVSFVLSGCSNREMLEKFSTPEDQALTKGYIERLRAGEFASITQDIDPSLRSANLQGQLEKMAALIPGGQIESIKLVGAQRNVNVSSNATTVNTTLEYSFGSRWIVANVATKTVGDKRTIVGFNIYPESQPLEETNRFTLHGRGVTQYAILTAAVAAILVTIVSLVICLRTKSSKRKWPWIICIMIGVGQISVNWTTGKLAFAPIYFMLFSAGAFAPLYGPWTVSVAVPVGAIVFLAYGRGKMLALSSEASRAVSSSATKE